MEKVTDIKFLYIVIDSTLEVHYEYNNKGHIILPIHWSEMNPYRIAQNLPKNLIHRCVSGKKNIVGVLQLWIYYTQECSYARLKAIGLLESFKGNRIKALFLLIKAMDNFCAHNKVTFVETETNIVPDNIMKRFGFVAKQSKTWWFRLDQFFTKRIAYVKHYS